MTTLMARYSFPYLPIRPHLNLRPAGPRIAWSLLRRQRHIADGEGVTGYLIESSHEPGYHPRWSIV